MLRALSREVESEAKKKRLGVFFFANHCPKKSSIVVARELIVLSETLGKFHVIRQGGGLKIDSFLGLLVLFVH